MYRTAAVGVQCEQEGAEQTTLGSSPATSNPECLQPVCEEVQHPAAESPDFK